MKVIEFINKFKLNKKLLVLIIFLFMFVTGGTYAYLYFIESDSTSINGNMGKVDLELDVTRVLPVEGESNEMLIFLFEELADNLNERCIDVDGDYSLCQLYRINLKNKDNGLNVKVKGSLSFNNTTMPNLSWILLGNTYDTNTIYTSDMLGDSFNKATLEEKNFVDSHLLSAGEEITYYILLWINEIDEIQYDSGTYTGIVKFEDSNGKGVTAEFEG